METTDDERIRPTSQQLQRLRRTEAKSQKALADFLAAYPGLSGTLSGITANRGHHSEPADKAVGPGAMTAGQTKELG